MNNGWLKMNRLRLLWIGVFLVCGAAAGTFTGRYALSFFYSGAIVGSMWMLWLVMKPHVLGHCPDCGSRPGEVHDFGCDVEECPSCHQQLISCGCWDLASDDDDEDKADEDDHENGKTLGALSQVGRIPYGAESRFSPSTAR